MLFREPRTLTVIQIVYRDFLIFVDRLPKAGGRMFNNLLLCFRNVGRLPKEGGQMERVGPPKFSRLNGIAAYKKANLKIGRCTFKLSLYPINSKMRRQTMKSFRNYYNVKN